MSEHFFVDLGTNTVRLLITSEKKILGKVNQEIHSYITGFGRGLTVRGELSKIGCMRTLVALRRFAKIIKKRNIEPGVSFATESLRKAMEVDPENTSIFLREAEKLGFSFEVISGEEEARLSFTGAVRGMEVAGFSFKTPLVFDIGGGSTEFSDGKRFLSLKIGSVSLKDRFADPMEAYKFSLEFLLDSRKRIGELKNRDLIGVAGTVTNVAAAVKGMEFYEPSSIQGSYVSVEQLRRLFHFFRKKFVSGEIEHISKLPGIEFKRAPVIPFGTALLLAIVEALDYPGFFVSDWSVLQGMAVEFFCGRS